MQTNNDLNQVKLRKYEHILVISGLGVVAFGIWSLIKAVVLIVTQPLSYLKNSFITDVSRGNDLGGSGFSEETSMIIAAIAILFVLTLDLLLRFYVGKSAVIDGRGLRKKRVAYVIVAALLAIGLISQIISRIVISLKVGPEISDDELNSIMTSNVLDITSFLALAEMTYCSIRVRRLRKMISSREEV